MVLETLHYFSDICVMEGRMRSNVTHATTYITLCPIRRICCKKYMEPELLHHILKSPPLNTVVDYFSPFYMSKPYFKMLPLCIALLSVLFRGVSPTKTLQEFHTAAICAACRKMGKLSRVLQRWDS
jgi:hypothetical protein